MSFPSRTLFARTRLLHGAFLCFCLFVLSACPVDPARKEFEEAESLMSQGALREAAQGYAIVVARYPGSVYAPQSQLKIARIYGRTRDYEKAEYAYSALFFMYPGSAEALAGREELAALHSSQGEHMKAIEEYQRLFQALPGSRQRFQYLIATEYIAMNDFAQARAELAELNKITENPGLSPRIRLHIAETYYLEGSYREALVRYDDVIRRFPENDAAVEAMLAKAVIHEEEGSFGKAVEILKEVRAKKKVSGLDERIRKLSGYEKAGRR